MQIGVLVCLGLGRQENDKCSLKDYIYYARFFNCAQNVFNPTCLTTSTGVEKSHNNRGTDEASKYSSILAKDLYNSQLLESKAAFEHVVNLNVRYR